MTTFSKNFVSLSGKPIQLDISDKSTDFVEITLINKNYNNDLKLKMQTIIVLSVLYVSNWIIFRRMIVADILCSLFLLYLIVSIFNLVKTEKLNIFTEFALQVSTERFMGRKSLTFINNSNVHDIVINEVICDLKIKYILNIRTKGSLYESNPVIPIFVHLEPGVDCLEIIHMYKDKLKHQLNTN